MEGCALSQPSSFLNGGDEAPSSIGEKSGGQEWPPSHSEIRHPLGGSPFLATVFVSEVDVDVPGGCFPLDNAFAGDVERHLKDNVTQASSLCRI
jgi:hypothetical protein